jgi:protein-disulfide isomerase
MFERRPSLRLAVPVDESDHSNGPPDAPVTLVGYWDYSSPECCRAYPVVKQILKRMRRDLRYVVRNFPQPDLHPRAEEAAEAAESAGSQGKFWEMHDRLCENPGALDEHGLARHAADLGLDLRAFQREMSAHVHADRVRRDVEGAIRSGVTETPAFFVDEVRHQSAFGLATLLPAVQAAAARAGVR